MEITAITELDAVNEMLSVIGESPVNTLENLQNIDAINALRILRAINRQEQARGWSFNIISEHTLNPDTYTKRIKWADNYLYLKGKYIETDKDHVFDIVTVNSQGQPVNRSNLEKNKIGRAHV